LQVGNSINKRSPVIGENAPNNHVDLNT